jgi:DNA-binding response OmpR family regulator
LLSCEFIIAHMEGSDSMLITSKNTMKKILIIEDNQSIRENTAEILELANYHVFTAENGKIGISLALENKPDLIICDIMMPELDGYGVLNIVQHNPSLTNVPFIFLTARAESGDIRRGMGLGADDYIAKPFSPTDLLNSIDSRLQKAEKIKQSSQGIAGINELLQIAGSETTLQTFVHGRSIDKYKKKQLIYTEGNHPVRLYYVQKGKVKIFVTNNEGKELIVSLCGVGDFFGYTPLFEGTVYKDKAAAMEETEVAIIPKNEFEELMRTSREVSQKFIKLLARDVADKEQHLLNIAYDSLRKKVADALLKLQLKYGENVTGNFSINISRENLAAVAGTATESLIRTLSDFRNEKLIEIKDSYISITDSDRLRKMLN